MTDSADGGRRRLEHREWDPFGRVLGVGLRDTCESGWDVDLAPFEALAAK